MAQGTIDLGGHSNFNARAEWTATPNGSIANSSTVTVDIYITSWGTLGTWSWTVDIDGQRHWDSKHTAVDTWTYMGSVTQTVKHNDSGYGSCSLYCKVSSPTGTSLDGAYLEKYATIDFDFIPRASSVTVPTSTIERTTTITINKAVDYFKQTLKYKFGSLSGTIVEKSPDSKIQWTVPAEFYTQIPNSTSGKATIECITFYKGTNLGSKKAEFTVVTDPLLCSPVLSPVVTDINATAASLTGNPDTLIRYYSDADIKANAQAQKSATLTGTTISCGSQTLNADGVIYNVEKGSFNITATDSRGYSTTQTVTKNLVEYITVTSNVNAQAPNAEGEMGFTISGNYFNDTFGVVANTLAVQYRLKENDGVYGEWVTINPRLNKASYSASTRVVGLNYRNTYTIQARAVDKLNDVLSADVRVKTVPIFNWGADNFNFNVPVNINGSTNINGEFTVNGKPINPYPVGAIYMSVNATSPAELFGGSWTPLKKCFLFAADDSVNAYKVGATGGEFEHKLVEKELPVIDGSWATGVVGQHGSKGVTGHAYGTSFPNIKEAYDSSSAGTQWGYGYKFGGNKPHNNMPPYLAVYMWKRVE